MHEKNDQWSREILETLQRALLSYSLQAKVLGSRLTPNTLLIRLKGSDRLRVEDIEKKKSVLLTPHGLSILNIIAQLLWLVHDEFADWMLVNEYKEAVSTSVQRLGTKARAAGIHLIFAAQRPEANVLPPQLRDNLGNRLILRVESQGTSEIALGEKGAEKLLGRGHLAAKLGGEITYAQVPFLSPEEQIQVVEEIRRQSYV